MSAGFLIDTNVPDTSSLSGVTASSGTFDADDRLSSETYDSNGNTVATGGKTFAYDSESRLVSMNSASVRIVYDGDGNRVGKTVAGVTTQYLVDGLNPTGYAQVVEELASGTVGREYTYGLQRINEDQIVSGSWTPSFYGYDGGGSVRFLTNTSGTITDTYEFDAWGNKVSSTGTTPNNYLYRAEQYDSDLGLDYLRARYYNPLTGRFLSRDPQDGKPIDPKTLHKYLYATGDPVNKLDPTGRYATDGYDEIVAEDEELAAPAAEKLGHEIAVCVVGIGLTIYSANHEDVLGTLAGGGLTVYGCLLGLYD